MSTTPVISKLTILDVQANGTIMDLTVPEPCIRRDVYSSISLQSIHSAEDLIFVIERCDPLIWHFQQLSQDHAAELRQITGQVSSVQSLLSGPSLSPGDRLILRALREDEDNGWQQWIEYSGDQELEQFKALVDDWLDSEIDWNESDYFEQCSFGQEVAKSILEDLPARVRKALGVVIVDGEFPGSSYCAAELRKSVSAANQVAELLELDVRFAAHVDCIEPSASQDQP